MAWVTDFAPARACVSLEADCGSAVARFCRSGFVWLATFSQSTRSSSLKVRLRRGGGPDDSVRDIEGGRFMERANHDGLDGDTARDSV